MKNPAQEKDSPMTAEKKEKEPPDLFAVVFRWIWDGADLPENEEVKDR